MKLNATGISTLPFDQVIINEYEPGQGISSHIDQPVSFGPEVVSVSLLSATTVVFSRENESHAVRLQPRSAVLLSGAARFLWMHAVPACEFDILPSGQQVERARRISVITFRVVKTVQ